MKRLSLVTAMLNLLLGLWSALIRAGVSLPLPDLLVMLPAWHGFLMVLGFMVSLIMLERAVEQEQSHFLVVLPLINAVSVLLGLLLQQPQVMEAMLISTNLFFIWPYVRACLRLPNLENLFTLMALASLNLSYWRLLSGTNIQEVKDLWIVFLLLIVLAERLILSGFRKVRSWGDFLIVFFALFIPLTASLASFGVTIPFPFGSVATLVVALTLMFRDSARIEVQADGVLRYTASGVLAGFVWLAAYGFISGLSQVSFGPFFYDAAVHSFFLGFIFNMVMAHAPLVFPTVMPVKHEFKLFYYSHLLLINVGLIVRIWGDLDGNWAVRMWGIGLTTAALVLFVLNNLLTMKKAERVDLKQ